MCFKPEQNVLAKSLGQKTTNIFEVRETFFDQNEF